jgi:hypothetical protein
MDNVTFKTINNESIIGEGNIEVKTTNIVNSSGETISFQSPTPVLSIINGDKDFYERQIIEINIDNYSELEFYDIQFSDNLSLDLGLNNGKFRLLASSLHDDFNGYIKVRSYSIANGTSWSDYGLLKVLIKALPTKLGNPIIVDDTNKLSIVDLTVQPLESHYEGIDSGNLIEKNTILDISESNDDKLILSNKYVGNSVLEYDIETNEGIIEKNTNFDILESGFTNLIDFFPLKENLSSQFGNEAQIKYGEIQFNNNALQFFKKSGQVNFPNIDFLIYSKSWTVSFWLKFIPEEDNTFFYFHVFSSMGITMYVRFNPNYMNADPDTIKSGWFGSLYLHRYKEIEFAHALVRYDLTKEFYEKMFNALNNSDNDFINITLSHNAYKNNLNFYINGELFVIEQSSNTSGTTYEYNNCHIGYPAVAGGDSERPIQIYYRNVIFFNRVLFDEEVKQISDIGIVDNNLPIQKVAIPHSLPNSPTKAILKDSDVSIKVDNKELEKSNTTLDIDSGLSTSDLSGLEFSADTFDVEISNPDKVKELKLIPIEEVSQ